MLTWATLWDLFKTAIIPFVALLWAILNNKVKKFDEEIEKLRDSNVKMQKDIVMLESKMITQEKLQESVNDLEQRLERIIALNIKPIEELVKRALSSQSSRSNDYNMRD